MATFANNLVFLSPGDAVRPIALNLNLHGQKDIAMLAKRLAACTRLSTTVSRLFEPQLQKIAIFTCPDLHFLCLTWGAPVVPSYSNRKCKKSPFSRTAAHIFVFLGDAPAIITQYVARMER